MSLLTSSKALLHQQLRLVVQPSPTTFADSRVLLRALDRFGSVISFFRPEVVPRGSLQDSTTTVLVTFSEPRAGGKALEAGPFLVEAGEADEQARRPSLFDFRSVTERKPVKKTSFHCRFERELDGAQRLTMPVNSAHTEKSNRKTNSVMSYDLIKSGAPLPALADVPRLRN